MLETANSARELEEIGVERLKLALESNLELASKFDKILNRRAAEGNLQVQTHAESNT